MKKFTFAVVALTFALIGAATSAQAPPTAQPSTTPADQGTSDQTTTPAGQPAATETTVPCEPSATGATYVGTQVCRGCHPQVYQEWLLTPHRRTLFDKKAGPAYQGCEACHGPGSAHVAAGGGAGSIVNPARLSAEKSTHICLRCHKQQEVMFWKASPHARNDLACTNCHNPHSPQRATMLRLINGARESVQGINSAISDARLAANSAANEEIRKEYVDKLNALQAQKKSTEKRAAEYESRFRRSEEPYLCFTCHRDVEVQMALPSHHPVMQDKVVCTDCHNPHGGKLGMMRGSTIPETCYRCHANVEGPFVFQHPPVTQDCMTCHRPHGSQFNYLLAQQLPFLCLKCHAGPHNRPSGGVPLFENEKRIAEFYWACTNCHFPHGSDQQSSFHI